MSKVTVLSEDDFIAQCRGWTGRMAEWTLRAKALRQERNALEDEIATAASKMAFGMIATGTPRADAEARVEQLIERACRP